MKKQKETKCKKKYENIGRNPAVVKNGSANAPGNWEISNVCKKINAIYKNY